MGARAERVGEELASGWQRMIDAKRLLSDCQALVRQLEADLAISLTSAPISRALSSVSITRRRSRSAHEDQPKTGQRSGHAGGCRLGARLRLRALPRRQRTRRHAPPIRHGRSASAGTRRRDPLLPASTLIVRRASTSRTRSGQSLRFQGAPAFRRAPQPALATADQRRCARDCSSTGATIDPQTGALVHDFGDPSGGRASSATSIRISPRRRASSTRCCRHPSSSRSSSSSGRSSRRSTSSVSRISP